LNSVLNYRRTNMNIQNLYNTAIDDHFVKEIDLLIVCGDLLKGIIKKQFTVGRQDPYSPSLPIFRFR
jgi:hypothetical protein